MFFLNKFKNKYINKFIDKFISLKQFNIFVKNNLINKYKLINFKI